MSFSNEKLQEPTINHVRNAQKIESLGFDFLREILRLLIRQTFDDSRLESITLYV